MVLDLSLNALLVELILLNSTSISQTRCIEDANLGKMLYILTTFIYAYTHHHAVLARKFVKSGGVSLALIVGTALLVGLVENVEIVMVNVVASKDIGNEFQE